MKKVLKIPRKINLLAVARWPLGGIRTYMKYVYGHLPADYNITILAALTQEEEALRNDATDIGARVILYNHTGQKDLIKEVFKELWRNKYDLIQSHGYTSAINAYFANLSFKVPHILTIHGVMEERFAWGIRGRFRMALTSWTIKNVDILHAVSNDMLKHIQENIPFLENAKCKKVVIHNGIDAEKFAFNQSERAQFRKKRGISEDVFLIGFLGRFMQQKGFDYLINAMEILERDYGIKGNIKVLAVGSDDYLKRYKRMIKDRNLEHRFIFIPFQKDVTEIYKDLDMVVMPSEWEAYGLLAAEALCSGVPLIASNCIGLRETVKGTPAIVFESKDSKALAEAIHNVITNADFQKLIFEDFKLLAIERFDIKKTVEKLDVLFKEVIKPIWLRLSA